MPGLVKLVDNAHSLKALLDKLATVPVNPPPLEIPCLYFDIEGVHLGRHGSISIISLHFLPDATTYLIDITVLGAAAFSTKNRQEYSIKSVLEFPGMPKVFFDVRNDSDALFSLYGISLAGVRDLQLMELAANSASRPHVSGLARCIERDLPGTAELKREWLRIKQETFDPKTTGGYEILNAQ